MAGAILPPNTPLIDDRGLIRAEWYRYLVDIQRNVDGVGVNIDGGILFAGTSTEGGAAAFADTPDRLAVEAQAMADYLGRVPEYFVPADAIERLWAYQAPDIIPPLPIEPDPADLSGYMLTGGSLALNIRTVTATPTIAANDYAFMVDATAGAITVALPAAASANKRILVVKKIDLSANLVTLDANGAETIDGALTQAIAVQYDSLTVHCDGVAWWRV